MAKRQAGLTQLAPGPDVDVRDAGVVQQGALAIGHATMLDGDERLRQVGVASMSFETCMPAAAMPLQVCSSANQL